jgi:hypothetical protein
MQATGISPNRPPIIEAKKYRIISQELCCARMIADLRPVRAPGANQTPRRLPPSAGADLAFGVLHELLA